MPHSNQLKNLLNATLAQIEADATTASQPKTPPPSFRLFKISEAAAALHCSRCTVWRMIKEGRLRTVELRQGSSRIPEQELIRLVGGAS